MMRSNGVPSDEDLPFKLGDLVLCRYSSYPYWPATVDQTHQKRFKGKFCAMLRTRGGEKVLAFWCTFANEDTGGWVRADRMVKFHPDLIKKIRLDKGSEWYNDQKDAIESTKKSFDLMWKDDTMKLPHVPVDMETKHAGNWDSADEDALVSDDEAHPALLDDAGDDDPMNLGGSDEEEDARPSKRQSGRHSTSSKAGKTPARPKAKKEPRKGTKRKSLPAIEPPTKKRAKGPSKLEKDLLETVDNDPEEPRRKADDRDVEEEVVDRSGKRRRHSYAHAGEPSKKARKLEAELSSAKETISALKKSLKKKEKALSELTGNGAGVACVIPPLPPPIEEPLPGRDKYRSVPVTPKKFGNLMDKLKGDYDGFKKAAEAADETRTGLEKTMETIKKLYTEASENVSAAEDKATKRESAVVKDLHEILEANVQVQNLRERKAGHVVRAMLKKCKDLPAIHNFCDAIYKSWKSQVVEYMKDNEGKLHQDNSPGGAKSSPSGKSERKSADSPTTNEKTPPKDKVKEEDKKASAAEDEEEKPSKEGEDKDGEMEDKDGETKDKDAEMKDTDTKSEDDKDEPTALKEEVKVKEENQKVPKEESQPNAEDKDLKDKPEKAERTEKVKKTEDVEKAEKVKKAEKTDKREKAEKADKKETADKSGKADKQSSKMADGKDVKTDDKKREDKPVKKEASESGVAKTKPDSGAKVEDKERPPAKSESK